MKKRLLVTLLAISLCMAMAVSSAFAAAKDKDEDAEAEETEDAELEEEEEGVFPGLDAVNHINYINGKGEGRFDPNGNLTRAEAAKMIAALLTSREYGEYETEFSDVEEDSWYAQSVGVLASWGILNGYEDESGKITFRPDANITRAEFVTMLCRFYDDEDGSNPFYDVAEDSWAASFIKTAADKGWINGYSDGSFGPERNITRAEAVKIINAVLNRSAEEEKTVSLIEAMGIRVFLDVESTDWYYCDVMEASVPHEYYVSNAAEVWSAITYQSCGYDPGWNLIGNFYYYVNENGQFEKYPSGIELFNGVAYYVDEQGRIPFNAAGRYRIDNIDYFVNALGQIPRGTTALYEGSDKTLYAVDARGRIVVNAAGKYTFDGINYYVDSRGQIPQGAAGVYAASNTAVYMVDSKGKIRDFSPGLQEIDKKLYYVNSDGTLAANTTQGYLYFGSTGAYTTGNSNLDNMVDAALSACVSSSMTKEEKLRAAYIYVRENFTYLARDHQPRGSMDWAQESAIWMFTNKKGNCYCFAAAFLYMARRLGYQAYPVSGGVGTKNSDHAWVMIYWNDGTPYMFDVELDYAYRYRYDKGVTYDLYKMTVDTAPFKYYFPS